MISYVWYQIVQCTGRRSVVSSEEDRVGSIVHCSLTKAQTVTYGVLGKQDGAPSVAFHIIHDPAQANPAGIHSIQDVGGSNIRVCDPDSDCTEGHLEKKPAVCTLLFSFYFETCLPEASDRQFTALGSCTELRGVDYNGRLKRL